MLVAWNKKSTFALVFSKMYIRVLMKHWCSHLLHRDTILCINVTHITVQMEYSGHNARVLKPVIETGLLVNTHHHFSTHYNLHTSHTIVSKCPSTSGLSIIVYQVWIACAFALHVWFVVCILCVCVCARTLACVQACIHSCMHACMHVCVCEREREGERELACMCVFVYAYVCS